MESAPLPGRGVRPAANASTGSPTGCICSRRDSSRRVAPSRIILRVKTPAVASVRDLVRRPVMSRRHCAGEVAAEVLDCSSRARDRDPAADPRSRRTESRPPGLVGGVSRIARGVTGASGTGVDRPDGSLRGLGLIDDNLEKSPKGGCLCRVEVC